MLPKFFKEKTKEATNASLSYTEFSKLPDTTKRTNLRAVCEADAPKIKEFFKEKLSERPYEISRLLDLLNQHDSELFEVLKTIDILGQIPYYKKVLASIWEGVQHRYAGNKVYLGLAEKV